MLKISVLLMCLFLFCSCSVKNCKIAPNYKEIGVSARKNVDNLAEIEIRSGQVTCKY